MSRSKWKFPTSVQQKNLNFWNRSIVASQTLLNKRVNIYNGKVFVKTKITKEHFGYKIGEFVFTRKFTSKKSKI